MTDAERIKELESELDDVRGQLQRALMREDCHKRNLQALAVMADKAAQRRELEQMKERAQELT